MSARQKPEKQMIPGAHIKEESGSTYKIRGGTFNHEETRFTGGGVCMTAVMATACGSKHTQTQETAAETTTEASDAETKAADTTKPDLSNVDPKMRKVRERSRQMRALKVYRWRRSPVRAGEAPE